jgi:hypothetical protein
VFELNTHRKVLSAKELKIPKVLPKLNPYPKSALVAATMKARISRMSFKCISMLERSDLYSSTLISI